MAVSTLFPDKSAIDPVEVSEVSTGPVRATAVSPHFPVKLEIDRVADLVMEIDHRGAQVPRTSCRRGWSEIGREVSTDQGLVTEELEIGPVGAEMAAMGGEIMAGAIIDPGSAIDRGEAIGVMATISLITTTIIITL